MFGPKAEDGAGGKEETTSNPAIDVNDFDGIEIAED